MDTKTKKMMDKSLKHIQLDFMETQIIDNNSGVLFDKAQQETPTSREQAEIDKYSRLVHKKHAKYKKRLKMQTKTPDGSYEMSKFLSNYLETFDDVGKFTSKAFLVQQGATTLEMLLLANMVFEVLKTTKSAAETKAYMREFLQGVQEVLQSQGASLKFEDSELNKMIDKLTKILQQEGLEIQTDTEEEAN